MPNYNSSFVGSLDALKRTPKISCTQNYSDRTPENTKIKAKQRKKEDKSEQAL